MKIQVAVFASGYGSNAENIFECIRTKYHHKMEVAFLFCDKTDAEVINRAKKFNIRAYGPQSLEKLSKNELGRKILQYTDEHRLDWIFLAGYMRLLSVDFLHEFAKRHSGKNQIVNLHPSLLPAYPGLEAMERSYADRVLRPGVSLHYVDAGLDSGPIISQLEHHFAILPDFATYKKQLQLLEYQIYANFIEMLANSEIATERWSKS